MDFLSNLFGLNESKAASASVPNGLMAKLNTPAPQLGGQRLRTRTGLDRTHKRRNVKRRTHKRK